MKLRDLHIISESFDEAKEVFGMVRDGIRLKEVQSEYKRTLKGFNSANDLQDLEDVITACKYWLEKLLTNYIKHPTYENDVDREVDKFEDLLQGAQQKFHRQYIEQMFDEDGELNPAYEHIYPELYSMAEDYYKA